MVAYKCDRCGKEVVLGETRTWAEEFDTIRIDEYEIDVDGNYSEKEGSSRKYDLCDECNRDFTDVLEKVKAKFVDGSLTIDKLENL